MSERIIEILFLGGLIKFHFLQTCLSKGEGFHFPLCHIVNVCGFRILFDCPMDLSALTIFSPVPTGFDAELDVKVSDFQDSSSSSLESVARKRQKIDKPLDANE